MSTIIFDIETGPLPDDQLQALMPEFKAAANLKDPAKIEAQIAEKREEWKANAALSAESGQVLAIGYHYPVSGENVIEIFPEPELLKRFWEQWNFHWSTTTWVGHNCMGFDFPFLIRRSWVRGIPVPRTAREMTLYRHPHVEDTIQVWEMGTKDRIGLDRLGKLLGVGGKNGHGSHFAELLKTDPEKAKEYLSRDLELTAAVWQRLSQTTAT